MSGHPDQVITVISHGPYWALRGIAVAMVEPTPDGGVRIGVRGKPAAAEAQLNDLPVPGPLLCLGRRRRRPRREPEHRPP
jgi:hypothetical protein